MTSVPDISTNIQTIRKVWLNDAWHYSVVDMINDLLNSDYEHSRSYWSTLKLKLRLDQESNKIIVKLAQAKLPAADHKMRFTDVADEKTWSELRKIVERVSFNRTKRVKLNRDEVLNLHPIVASLLESEGWQVSHHVDLPSGRTMDILAERAGQIMIVECKKSLREGRYFSAIGQVLCYVAEYGNNAHPAIACFADGIDDYAYQMCQRLGIQLLQL